MAITLRDWLDRLDGSGLLNRVGGEVAVTDIAAIIADNRTRATLFENIGGYAMKLAANTFSNRRMMALALDCGEGEIVDAMGARRERRIAPVIVDDAPCREVIQTGGDVNLAEFPLHLQHELDGAPYISASVVVARDPSRGVSNLGIYRMMYRTRNETGVDVTAPHKLRRYYQQACETGRPLEVAAVLGLPAIDMLAALSSTPFDVDEFEVLGGFRGEPAELVRCETVDLLVPANAEIVIEGEMLPTGWTADEGPYGEFSGTYGGSLKRNPTIRIKAITRRRDAVFLSATHGGLHPGATDMHGFFPGLELDIHAALRQAGIDVCAVRALPASSGMWVAASIRPLTKGDARTALVLILSASKQAFPKFAVVVDDDIDIFDDERLHWAMTWRCQPHRDVMILNDMKAVPLDPSLPSATPPVTTSKMGIDATIPVERNRSDFEVCRPAAFEPVSGIDPAPSADEIDDRMAAFITERAPVHFRDIAAEFAGAGWRTMLEAFGRLREDGRLGRDTEGRYTADGVG